MKVKRYGSLGSLTVPVQVYTSFDEASKAAGSMEKAIDILNDNLHYRGGPAAETRDFICELVEKKMGIKREVRPVMDKDGKPRKDSKGAPITEPVLSEGKYIAAVLAAKKLDDLSSLQPDVDAWAKSVPVEWDDTGKVTKTGELAVDAATPEREPKGPTKLAQKYKDVALQFLTGKKDLAKLNAAFGKSGIATFTIITKDEAGAPIAKDAEVNVDTLGRLCKQWEAAQDVFGKVG